MASMETHAVRWARREIKSRFDMDWTRWHRTSNAFKTDCGIQIRIAIEGGTFLPETDDAEQVDCKHCLAKTLRPNTSQVITG